MGVITFNNTSSATIKLQVERPPNYDIPERIYETIPVPGRNGDVIMDTGAYANSKRVYEVSLGEEDGDFSLFANKLSGWLHSAPGYLRLEDSYLPGYYMMARYAETNNIVNILQQAGRATITFDRYPQRFLRSGENGLTVNTRATITNPTGFDAKPLIKINGSGNTTLTVGGYKISITGISGYMFIDCETEQAYKDALNMNNNITLSNNEFPILKKGQTTISYTDQISNLVVTPRWWTL